MAKVRSYLKQGLLQQKGFGTEGDAILKAIFEAFCPTEGKLRLREVAIGCDHLCSAVSVNPTHQGNLLFDLSGSAGLNGVITPHDAATFFRGFFAIWASAAGGMLRLGRNHLTERGESTVALDGRISYISEVLEDMEEPNRNRNPNPTPNPNPNPNPNRRCLRTWKSS